MKALIEKMDRYDAANNDGHIRYAIVINRMDGHTEVTIYSNMDEAGEFLVAHGESDQQYDFDPKMIDRAIAACMKKLEVKNDPSRVRN